MGTQLLRCCGELLRRDALDLKSRRGSLQSSCEPLQSGVMISDTPNDFPFGSEQPAAGQEEQNRVVHAIEAIDHARLAKGGVVFPDKAECSA